MGVEPGPNGYSTAGLRDDARQWLIYQEPQMGAVMRALEMAALGMCGRVLARSSKRSARGVGNFMAKVAEARMRTMTQQGGVSEAAVLTVAAAMQFWQYGNDDPAAERAADEVYATVFQLDSRANGAGITGPGTIREAIRGD
jgi:hypothetical protein